MDDDDEDWWPEIDPAPLTVEYADPDCLALWTPNGWRIGRPTFGFSRALHPDGIEWVP